MTETRRLPVDQVRVRFCPSPTGNPHVGMIRTALFNWAFARHTGGTLVFRIEDTDASRDSEQSYEDLLSAMSWLGLDWDEGPEVGGPYGPYRQSQRRVLYADAAVALLEAGRAYECFCSPEEVEQRYEVDKQAAKDAAAAAKESVKSQGADNKAANAEYQRVWKERSRQPGYDGHCRHLTQPQRQQRRDAGESAVLRFRMPEGTIEWQDLVRGPMSFDTEHVPDFVLVRANGDPLYPLVNPLDDAAMAITHVLRGEDLLSSTPRQIALYDALIELGLAQRVPEFGHLPYVMGEGNKKLSKRDPESSLQMYREQGYLPEGLLNYLALLGWSLPRGWPLPADLPTPPGVDLDADPDTRERDIFAMDEVVAAFDLARVNPNPARFDLAKCTAINGDHMRWLSADELYSRLLTYLRDTGFLADSADPAQEEVLRAAVPLIQERMQTMGEAPAMIGFLFMTEADFAVDPADAAKLLDDKGRRVVAAAVEALDGLPAWSADQIEGALRTALIDGMGLKPRLAFGPVRVAVTGRRISPPLFESMELLGREESLTRLRAAT